MEGYTYVDAITAGVILLSGILAFSRGFVRESLALLGWVAAAIVAFFLAPTAEPLVAGIPMLNRFTADSCELSLVAAFVGVFAVTLIIAALLSHLFSSLVRRSFFGSLDQGLGFLFGVARGVLLVAIAFFVYDIATSAPIDAVIQSRSHTVFMELADEIKQQDPEHTLNWITGKYRQLIGSCGSAA